MTKSVKSVGVVYHFFPHYRAAIMMELVKNGSHPYVLMGDTCDPDKSIEPWVLPVDVPFLRLRNRKIVGSFLWQAGLIKQVLRPSFSAFVFLANPHWPSIWLAAALARLSGKRVLFWTHGWVSPETGAKRLVRNLFYRLAHGLLLYGHGARQQGMAEGFCAEDLYVIYNSLNYEEQRQVRDTVTTEELQRLRSDLFGVADMPIVVCTSRLTAVRGLDLLFDAAKRLADDGHSVGVLLVGDGPEKARLEALAVSLRLPVHFYGACYDEHKLARLIMASAVTVAPGKVGLTAMHSLAYGIPVITHSDAKQQMPEWEAIRDGLTGGLFRHDDVDSLAEVIFRWTRQASVDLDTRRRCIEVIEQYYNPVVQRVLIERALHDESTVGANRRESTDAAQG